MVAVVISFDSISKCGKNYNAFSKNDGLLLHHPCQNLPVPQQSSSGSRQIDCASGKVGVGHDYAYIAAVIGLACVDLLDGAVVQSFFVALALDSIVDVVFCGQNIYTLVSGLACDPDIGKPVPPQQSGAEIFKFRPVHPVCLVHGSGISITTAPGEVPEFSPGEVFQQFQSIVSQASERSITAVHEIAPFIAKV